MLTEMGWPITVDEVVQRFVGGSSDAMLAEIERHLGPERTAEFDRRSTEEIVAAFHAELEPVEGVRDVVQALHQHKVPTCIASSGSHRKMELTLGLTGLRPLFEGRIYSGSEVARGKPWPDLFVYAARSMGAEPSRCCGDRGQHQRCPCGDRRRDDLLRVRWRSHPASRPRGNRCNGVRHHGRTAVTAARHRVSRRSSRGRNSVVTFVSYRCGERTTGSTT